MINMKCYGGNFFSTVLILIPVVVEVQGLVGPEVVVRLEGRAVVVFLGEGVVVPTVPPQCLGIVNGTSLQKECCSSPSS